MNTMPRLIAAALAVVMTAAGTALAFAPAAFAHPAPAISGTTIARVSPALHAQVPGAALADSRRDTVSPARG